MTLSSPASTVRACQQSVIFSSKHGDQLNIIQLASSTTSNHGLASATTLASPSGRGQRSVIFSSKHRDHHIIHFTSSTQRAYPLSQPNNFRTRSLQIMDWRVYIGCTQSHFKFWTSEIIWAFESYHFPPWILTTSSCQQRHEKTENIWIYMPWWWIMDMWSLQIMDWLQQRLCLSIQLSISFLNLHHFPFLQWRHAR